MIVPWPFCAMGFKIDPQIAPSRRKVAYSEKRDENVDFSLTGAGIKRVTEFLMAQCSFQNIVIVGMDFYGPYWDEYESFALNIIILDWSNWKYCMVITA